MTRRVSRPATGAVPSYLPPWPTRWPTNQQQANRMVEDMRPHATTIRAGRAAGAIVLTVATLVLLVTLHPLISIPVIVGIAAGVCGNQHRTRRRRARIEKQRQRPYKLPRSDR